MAALEGEITPLKTQVTQHATAAATWARERAFLAAGIADAEAQEVAALFHARIPEAERPELGTWLASLKADPTKAPKALAAYLGPPAAPPPAGAPPAAPPPAAVPPNNVQVVGASATAGGVVTAEAIRAASAKALRSNTKEDWAAYDALKASVENEKAARK